MAEKTTSISSAIGNVLKMPIFYIQDYSILSFESVRLIFTMNRYSRDMVEQMDLIGVGSVLIIFVALFCIGGVIVLNAASCKA